MKVLHVRVPRLLVCVLLGVLVLYVMHVVGWLLGRYGSLFYIETYLPSPPLPPQRRERKSLQVPPGPRDSGRRPLPHSHVELASPPRYPQQSHKEFTSSSGGKLHLKSQRAEDFKLPGVAAGVKPPNQALQSHNFSVKRDGKFQGEIAEKLPETSGVKSPREAATQSSRGLDQHGTVTKLQNGTLDRGRASHSTQPLVRLLCLIVTSPRYHDTRAVHVKNTWASHCDRTVFLSSEAGPQLGEVVVVPQASEYNQLWQKVVAGFEWSTEHEQEYEWLIKVDDDSFLLVENLRFLLRDYEPDLLYATGLFLKDWDTEETYLNGGAGYAVSRAGVQAVAGAAQPGGRCTQEGGMAVTDAEDLNMAACFRALGVQLLDSRDEAGHQRFNVYPPQNVIDPRRDTDWVHLWLKKIAVFPYKFGFTEMSSDVISFHYVDAESMYLLYYLLYIVNPRLSNHDRDESWHGDAFTYDVQYEKTKLFNNRKRRSSLPDIYKRTEQVSVASEPEKVKLSSLKKTIDSVQSDKKYYGVVHSKTKFSFRDLHEQRDKFTDSSYPKPDIEEIGPKDYSRRKLSEVEH